MNDMIRCAVRVYTWVHYEPKHRAQELEGMTSSSVDRDSDAEGPTAKRQCTGSIEDLLAWDISRIVTASPERVQAWAAAWLQNKNADENDLQLMQAKLNKYRVDGETLKLATRTDIVLMWFEGDRLGIKLYNKLVEMGKPTDAAPAVPVTAEATSVHRARVDTLVDACLAKIPTSALV